MNATPARFDVLIIGAGPAGGAGALALANSGLRFAVLERDSWPRHKPCGGALPFPVHAHLPIDWESIWSLEVTRVVSRFRGADERVAHMAQPAVHMIQRHEFDAAIVHAAQKAAGERMQFHPHAQVKSVTRTDGGRYAARTADGRTFQARFIIMATGSYAQLARQTGFARPGRPALALEYEVEVSPACYAQQARQLTFDHGRAAGGYAWVFPKRKPWLACGIGGYAKPSVLKAQLQAFLETQLGHQHIRRIVRRGHPLALYQPCAVFAREGILLAGDAASLIDPVSGEGIWYALKSGQLAANTVATQFRTSRPGAPPAELYSGAIERDLAPALDACARLAVPDLLQAPAYFYRRFLASGHSYQQFYLALQQATRQAKATSRSDHTSRVSDS